MKILVLDDAPAYAFAIDSFLMKASDLLDGPAEVVYAEDVDQVRRYLDDGAEFAVAIIDLGLGPTKESGLGAISLMETAGVPTAVHSEYQEATRRLMFLYAAFTWFSPLALIPKVGFTPGDHDLPRKFVSQLVQIRDGKTPLPDLAKALRSNPHVVNRAFDRIITSSEDLDKWRMFVQYSRTKDVAASLNLSNKRIENWTREKYSITWELLRDAKNFMDTSLADILDPFDPEIEGYRDNLGVIHQFARSQSWFFTDPVVHNRYASR